MHSPKTHLSNRNTELGRTCQFANRTGPVRVLVADAKPVMRAGLKTILEPAGFVITSEASHSKEIFPKLAKESVDVLTLDPGLPGRGLDIIPDIKRRHPNTAVLVYADEIQQQFLMPAIKSGADGFLLKEAATDQLLRALDKVSQGEQFIPDSLAAALAKYVRGEQQPHEKLSPREQHILQRFADGKSLKEIAGELGIDAKTVSTHKRRIMDKMGMQTNAELIQYGGKLVNRQ